MAIEKDNYYTVFTYGQGTERLSQYTKPLDSLNNETSKSNPNTEIASRLIGKVYLQNDERGSIIKLSNEQGKTIKTNSFDVW